MGEHRLIRGDFAGISPDRSQKALLSEKFNSRTGHAGSFGKNQAESKTKSEPATARRVEKRRRQVKGSFSQTEARIMMKMALV